MEARPAAVGIIRHPVHQGPSHCRDNIALRKQVRKKGLFRPSDEGTHSIMAGRKQGVEERTSFLWGWTIVPQGPPPVTHFLQ